MEFQTIITQNTEHIEFQIKDYSGPLDLLIALIEKNDINIYNVSIAEITNQYLDYLQEQEDNIAIEAMSEFQLMASYLIYLKARLLVPKDREEEEHVFMERDEFIDLLLRYHRYRKLAEYLGRNITLPMLQRKHTYKELPAVEEKIMYNPAVLLKLRNYYQSVLYMRQIYRMQTTLLTITMQDKIGDITELMKTKRKFSFFSLIHKRKVLETICTFLALLELAKQGVVTLTQEQAWEDILCMAADYE